MPVLSLAPKASESIVMLNGTTGSADLVSSNNRRNSTMIFPQTTERVTRSTTAAATTALLNKTTVVPLPTAALTDMSSIKCAAGLPATTEIGLSMLSAVATESIELTSTTELGLSMLSAAKSCKMFTDGDKTQRTTVAWMEDHNFLVGSEDGLFQKFHARFADKSTTGSQVADTSLPHTQCHAISRIALTPSPHNWIGTASNDCTVAVSKYVVNFTNTLNVDRSHKNFVQGAPWHLFNSSLYSCSQFSTVPERDITDSDDMKDRIKDYLKKRDCGVLLCEKRRGVSDLVTSKVELRTTRDEFVTESTKPAAAATEFPKSPAAATCTVE